MEKKTVGTYKYDRKAGTKLNLNAVLVRKRKKMEAET